MRWKVGIAGQHAVLHQLAIVVSNDDMRLEVRDDVAILTGARLDALDDIGSVQREAERIVTIMSAFARLLLGVSDSLRVVDVAETPAAERSGATAGSAMSPSASSPQATAGAGTSGRTGAADAWPRSSLLQSLRLVLSNPAMEQALSLRDTSRLDGSQLSQICRIIEAAAGRSAVARFSGMSQAALQRLHAAANSGADADDAAPDGAGDRMTLAEARSLVDRLLMAWVGSAARHMPGLDAR
jgi:hypothetical protein